MKQKLLTIKMLLAAAGLCAGASALAYDVPDGYEIKTVFVGTDNGDNTVTPENFSSGTYDSSIFGPGTCYHATESEKLKVVDYTYIAPPAIGELAVDDENNVIYPTYVGANGKVIRWHSRSNATQYGTIAMNPVSTGKLVFGVDLNFGGYNTNYAPQIIFVDEEGNSVLQLGFSCGSGDTEYFQYKVGNGTATNDGTVGSSKLRGKYTGHSVRDIIIDMETGNVVYTVDCIGTNGKRQVNTSTKGVNIGTGKTIAGIRLSRNFAQGSQSDYIWADNIELYTVGVESSPHTYTVKATAGSTELTTIQSGSLKAGQIYSVTVNEVIEKDGKFYRLDDNTVTNYTKSYTMGDAEENQTINYVEDANIVFYSELEGATYEETSTSASGGTVRGFNSTTNVTTTLDNGEYQILVKVTGSRHSKAGSWRGFSMSLDGTEFASYVGQSAAEHSFSLIVPQDNQVLKFYRGYNESDWIDYIIVKKTADLPANVTKNMTDAGWATYCSPYILDFSSEIANLDAAYIVTGGEDGVLTKTEVDGTVPAGTGLLLKGSGDVTIPVAVIAAFDVTGNKLEGTVSSKELAVEAGYVLLGSGDNGLGFYQNANIFTLSANTAYLPTGFDGASARPSFFRLTGGITGISAIQMTEAGSKDCYNLCGQRVAQPSKGMYIVDGKKVIVK